MTELVSRFATSQPRIEILIGLLNYRERLRTLNIAQGFQWIDGSFVEDVEQTRSAPPGDVDVVTFAPRPMADSAAWNTLIQANLDVFDPVQSKVTFRCDAYFVDLAKDPGLIVRDTAYWFGLFSHQRATSLWKGMLIVPLNSDDALARTNVVGR